MEERQQGLSVRGIKATEGGDGWMDPKIGAPNRVVHRQQAFCNEMSLQKITQSRATIPSACTTTPARNSFVKPTLRSLGQNEDNTEYDAHNRRLGVVASATHATPRTRISESIASGLSVNEMMRGFSPQRFSSPSPKRERERERS